MLDWIAVQTAGLWPMFWKFNLGGLLILGLLAAAWFSPIYKSSFVWAAAVVAAFTFAFSLGVKDGEHRIRAQWDAALEAQVNKAKKARANADRSIGDAAPDELRNDPDNRDND